MPPLSGSIILPCQLVTSLWSGSSPWNTLPMARRMPEAVAKTPTIFSPVVKRSLSTSATSRGSDMARCSWRSTSLMGATFQRSACSSPNVLAASGVAVLIRSSSLIHPMPQLSERVRMMSSSLTRLAAASASASTASARPTSGCSRNRRSRWLWDTRPRETSSSPSFGLSARLRPEAVEVKGGGAAGWGVPGFEGLEGRGSIAERVSRRSTASPSFGKACSTER